MTKARLIGARLGAHESGVRLTRAFGSRVKHHLAVLAWKAQRLPAQVVGVPVLGTVVVLRQNLGPLDQRWPSLSGDAKQRRESQDRGRKRADDTGSVKGMRQGDHGTRRD